MKLVLNLKKKKFNKDLIKVVFLKRLKILRMEF